MNEPDADAAGDGDYWNSARRPLSSLAFVAPLVLFYEAGVLLLGGNQADSLRNGADFWMRSLLNPFGSCGPWLLPILVGAALLGWHAIRGFRWRVESQTLLGMSAESLLFATCLIVLGQASDLCFQRLHTVAVSSTSVTAPVVDADALERPSHSAEHELPVATTDTATGSVLIGENAGIESDDLKAQANSFRSRRKWTTGKQPERNAVRYVERKSVIHANDRLNGRSAGKVRTQSSQTDEHATLAPWLLAVSFVGAGVYEEALFRLWMLPAIYLVMLALQLPRKPALYGAVFASSLLFTIAHYIGAGADRYDTFTFTFRLLAGHCFAALFLTRGFGIAAGTHAMYDLLVGVLLRPV